MDIEEYENEGREAYATFAAKIAEILTTAINSETDFRLQQIKDRAKQTTSLLKKLEDRGIAETTTLENDIKDLAGCRVIFYTNSDVTRFINSGIINQNFEVLEVKLHHPRREIEDVAELYISNHYIVRLPPERIALHGYARFDGMRCEIQIQTILNHAWAEMAHDTIYKAPALGDFGATAFESIKSRMQKVARKHIVPAGYEFQKIASDFERLIDGKTLFDSGALEAIVAATNNNLRAEALESFSENILPFYDDPQAVYPEIVEQLIAAADRARSMPKTAIETPFGTLPGKTYSDIIESITDILTHFRYLDVETTFGALCTLFGWSKCEDDRKILLKLGSTLAKHQLHVWRKQGPIVQSILVDSIGGLQDDECRALGQLVIEMLREILGSEVHGTTSSSNALTIHRGSITPSGALYDVRKKAIDLLKRQFALAKSEEERGTVLQALQAATRRPMGTEYSNELLRLVMLDTRTIVEYQKEIAPMLSFELLQSVESRVHTLYWMYSDLPETICDDPDLVSARAEIQESALVFRDAANSNPDFVIYKTLVGFESVFPPAWENKEFAFKQAEAYRTGHVDELLASVDETNSNVWLDRINRCAQTESNDLATFPVFNSFLERLAEAQPVIVLGYIDQLEGALTNFLPWMLSGLIRSQERSITLARIEAWLLEGVHIGHIAWHLRFANPFDEEMLQRTLDCAAKHDDASSVRTALVAAADQFDAHPGTLIESVFLPALHYLNEAGDFSWIQIPWVSWYKNPILRALDEKQAAAMLHILVAYPKLESNAEYIVAAVAERWPERVVSFIGERQVFARKGAAPPRYDAVPYSVHQLQPPLSKVPDILLDGARSWFSDDPLNFPFDGGKLLASVFPDLENGLKERLEVFISGGNEEDVAFVLGVLSAYEGRPCIYELIRMIVATLIIESPLLSKAQSALDETGVVSGEFGFAELHEERKALLEPWIEDHSELVRAFAEERIRKLDLLIAAENRSAEASIALRRLEYGEELDDNGE